MFKLFPLSINKRYFYFMMDVTKLLQNVQVLIQGNQTRAVESLLTVDYKLPRKYLKGLENAPKKKGKQK